VEHRIGLLLDRRDHRFGRVPQVEDANSAGEVDVLLAVDVDQACSMRVIGHDRRQRHRPGHVLVALRQQRLSLRSCHLDCHSGPLFVSSFVPPSIKRVALRRGLLLVRLASLSN
jgi:hypothetical protein